MNSRGMEGEALLNEADKSTPGVDEAGEPPILDNGNESGGFELREWVEFWVGEGLGLRLLDANVSLDCEAIRLL